MGMKDEVKITLRVSDVRQALGMYINQMLLKRSLDVIDLELAEDDNGEDLFVVTLEEQKAEPAD